MSNIHDVPPESLSQRELDILYQLVHDLARSVDVPTMASHLFTQTQKLLKPEYAALLLANENATELRGTAAYGFDDESFRQERIDLYKEFAPAVLAFQQRRPVVTIDWARSPLVSARLQKAYGLAQSVWVTPLMNGAKAIGTFLIAYASRKEAAPEELRLLQLLGDEAGLAIERARLTDELRERNGALQALIYASPMAIVVLDPDGIVQMWNPAAEWMFGWSAQEALGQRYPIVPPEEWPEFLAAHKAVLHGHTFTDVERHRRRKDGSLLIVNTSTALLRDASGNAVSAMGVITDITARRQAEDALRESEERYRALVENISDVVYTADANGRVTYLSPAVESLSGYAPTDLVGRPFMDFIHPEDLPRILAGFQRTLAGNPEPGEWRIMTRSGELRWVIGSVCLVRNDSETPTLFGVIHDINDRKQREEALRMEAESEAALAYVGRELLSSLNTPELLDRLCRLTAEVLECDYSHTLLLQSAEDAYVAVAGYGETQEETETRQAFKIPRSAFSRLIELLDKHGVVERRAETLRDPITLSVLRRLHTSTMLWLPLRHGAEIIGVQSAGYRVGKRPTSCHTRIARGISQIASLALTNAKLFEELERANRLKEDFISSVSHELRTPLNIILGYTELLREEAFGPLGAQQTHTLARIEKSARELFDLITTLLDLSSLQHSQHPVNIRIVNVESFFTELALDIRQLATSSPLTIDWQPVSSSLVLLTDPVKLQMILKNLILNALKFTEQGSIVITTQQGDEGITFSVQDTGIGIAPDALPFIFEPFRQVDNSPSRKQKGVGLGLYIVRQLVDLLGGKVSVASELGKGSTFQVWLPIMNGESR